MSRKLAFLFPGQGAQTMGMGKDFFEHFSSAKETFQEADDVLGIHLSKVVFEGPQEELTRTDRCQVAIFVTSVALLRTLQSQFPDFHPVFCAGLSLGEYTALTAAGALPFADCLQLVKRRSHLMHQACTTHPGTMAVVIGKTPQEVETLLQQMGPGRTVWMANLNCPGQVVLAGTQEGIAAAERHLKAAGVKRMLSLDVAGAFHCPLMEEARRALEPHILTAPLRQGDAELVMNAKGGIAGTIEEMRRLLIEQVTAPVYWEKGVRAMEERGVDLYVEIGPGTTLAGMNRRIGTQAETVSIGKIEDLETIGAKAT